LFDRDQDSNQPSDLDLTNFVSKMAKLVLLLIASSVLFALGYTIPQTEPSSSLEQHDETPKNNLSEYAKGHAKLIDEFFSRVPKDLHSKIEEYCSYDPQKPSLETCKEWVMDACPKMFLKTRKEVLKKDRNSLIEVADLINQQEDSHEFWRVCIDDISPARLEEQRENSDLFQHAIMNEGYGVAELNACANEVDENSCRGDMVRFCAIQYATDNGLLVATYPKRILKLARSSNNFRHFWAGCITKYVEERDALKSAQ
jgi:hypothetical protein